MSYCWQSRIRFVDTDASQRIHYTALFRHFEAAEHEFLRHEGISYSAVEFRDISFPRVHVECDFQSQIKFDDPISIEVTVERVGNASYTISFATTVDGRAAAKGKVTVVTMDKSTQRSCPIPAPLLTVLRRHLT